MLTKLSSLFYRISSGPVTLIALLIFFLFVVFVLPKQAQRAEVVSKGAGSPDTSYFYSSTDLYNMAETYGVEGRAAYVHARFTFDLIFPLTYLFFLTTSISWALAHAAPNAGSRWRLLNLFPAFGFLFDYLENVATSAVMLNYPNHTPVLDSLAPVFTLVKWFFVDGSFVILIPAALIVLWNWVRGRRGHYAR